MAPKPRSNVDQFLHWWTPVRMVGLLMGLFGLSIAIFGTVYKGPVALDIVQAFYANVSTEAMSIAITIILIDWLHERRDARQSKERLVRQMRTPDNGLALQAIEELRAEGWLNEPGLLAHKYLWDANLKGANLAGVDLRGIYLNRANLETANLNTANLQAAHLERANLTGAHLDKANLDHADLHEAHLRGARLVKALLSRAHLHGADITGASLDETDLRDAQVHDAQLINANRLRGAIMPDGSLYDGRFNLPGDLDAARRDTIAAADMPGMARFYGVSMDAYEHGQQWATGNIAHLRLD